MNKHHRHLPCQPEMSLLNVLYDEQYPLLAGSVNKYDMSVTPLVSHVDICPYVVVALASSSHQAETAVRRLAVSVMAVVSFLLVATDGKIATAL